MSWGKQVKRPAKKKAIPTSGRNVEGETFVVVLVGGEKMLSCKKCGANVPVARWWGHGTAEDPHLPT